MTASRKRYQFVPAVLTWHEAAEYAFRKSEHWLRQHLEDPELAGFPRPDQAFGTFAKVQVDAWLASRYGYAAAREGGLAGAPDYEAVLIGRAGEQAGGKRPRTISGREAA
jgi:hypothetical protein